MTHSFIMYRTTPKAIEIFTENDNASRYGYAMRILLTGSMSRIHTGHQSGLQE